MHAVILGGNSDIGKQIMLRLQRDNWDVTATYRGMLQTKIPCWDLLVNCIGTLEPIGLFVELSESALETMNVNLIFPLEWFSNWFKFHNPNASIMFFSGANTNSAHPNYFAYSIAKIATIKAMELLDEEVPDCKFFSLGPGYIPTKMHDQIRKAGLEPSAKLKGASHDDVYECLMWAHSQPKAVIGGRNIAVHTDDWRNPEFAERLAANPEIYKLRRLTDGK